MKPHQAFITLTLSQTVLTQPCKCCAKRGAASTILSTIFKNCVTFRQRIKPGRYIYLCTFMQHGKKNIFGCLHLYTHFQVDWLQSEQLSYLVNKIFNLNFHQERKNCSDNRFCILLGKCFSQSNFQDKVVLIKKNI